jgi:hypothetical protein
VAATTGHFGKLDVLVNNAGISGSAEQDFYSTDAWHRIMAVNATGAFFGIKHAISAMIANGAGSIVNLSSIAGIIGSEHVHIAYNASKAAVRLMRVVLHHRFGDPRRRRYSRHMNQPPHGVVARDEIRGPRRPSSTARGFPRAPSAKSCWEGRYEPRAWFDRMKGYDRRLI